MTHQPYLSPTVRYRGQFVLDDNGFRSASVTEGDDKSHPHRAEVGSGRRRADRRPSRSWAR